MSKTPRLITDRCAYIPELVRGLDVLDIGCVEHSLENRRRGKWLHEFVRKSAKSCLGLDYEEAEVAKMKAEGFDVIAADATDFDLGRQFDAVVCGEVIEHVLNAGGLMRSIRKHLRPGGFAVISTPNGNNLTHFLQNLFLGREIDNADHVALYTPTTIGMLFQKTGFRIDRVTFVAENTMYLHRSPLAKAGVAMKMAVQLTLGYLQPSICHHMLVIARPA